MSTLLNYMRLAQRTNKDGELIEINEKIANALFSAMPNMINAASQADRLKASLVYGQKLRDKGTLRSNSLTINDTPQVKEMLHALLGLVSESGELVEAFYDSILNDKPLDTDNVIEELGDLLWFIALFARNLGTDLESIATINIEKLKVRYPEKFTEELAINRDLEGELNAIKG